MAVGDDMVSVRFANLSLGGALVTGVDKLPMGTKVTVSFSVPTLDQPISVEGTVRWASEGVIGLQFSNLRARETWSLNKYFEQLSGGASSAGDEETELDSEDVQF